MTRNLDQEQREPDVLAAVAHLVDSLLDDFDVVELLTSLTEHCVHLLDVASAGLLLADARDHLHLMAATSERTQELEVFQLQTDEGPCLDCYRSAAPVLIADLDATGDRWPRFVVAARKSGFVSVHALPMRAGGTMLGALGLFGTEPTELSDADVLIGQTLAHIASAAIVQHDLPSRTSMLPTMHSAIASRIVVEQAKGYLRERFGISVADAFALLRRYAGGHDEHLTDVARTLVSDRAGRPALLTGLTEMAGELSIVTH